MGDVCVPNAESAFTLRVSGNKSDAGAFERTSKQTNTMANMKFTEGTLFMALEAGAAWPQYLCHLRKTAANVQAVVQLPGEPAELFAKRVLERWQYLLNTSAPPHRFVLGPNVSWDVMTSDTRYRLARGVLGEPTSAGAHELILWGGNSKNAEEQGRLLALAGALVEGHATSRRAVRVLFSEPASSVGQEVTPYSAQPRMYLA